MLPSDVNVLERTTLNQVEQILDAHTREKVPVTRWTQFSWSVSRHHTFERCKRAYYLQYYGARRVREANNKVVSAVWWLKQLTAHNAWIGTVIHEVAAEAVKAHREGIVADEQILTQQAIDLYNDGIQASQRGARLDKRWVIIREMAYEEGFEPDPDRVKALMETFFRSEAFEFIQSLPPEAVLEVDEPFQSFEFVTNGDTTPVYAIPDALLVADETYHIIDWKTGHLDEQTIATQAGVYYVYTNNQYDAESFQSHFADLNTGQSQHPFATVEDSHHLIKESINTMKAHIEDENYHTVSIHQFPMTDNLTECETCPFKRICWRHE